MALASAARVPLQRRMSELNFTPLSGGFLWAAFITLIVAGPWLVPGYLFGTDWPGPRRFDFPTDLNSTAPVEVLVAVASTLIGGAATGKLFVFGFLFAGCALAYRAAPVGGFIARAAASAVFIVNPFVYGRLHYGQMFVLAGYAVLPWAVHRFRRLLIDPRPLIAVGAAAAMTLVGILSVHMFLVAILVVGAVASAYEVGALRDVRQFRSVNSGLAITAATTFVASSYWIVPVLLSRGVQANQIAGIGSGDLNAFAAVSDRQLGLVPNLLGLYGFWAEASGRFISMKAFVPGWPAVLGVLLALCAIGGAAAFRNRDQHLAPWVAGLIAAAAVALILEMGVSNPLTAGLVEWIDAHIPVYRGMRDAGKWAALLALVYSQLAALGAVVLLDWLRKIGSERAQSGWLISISTALLLAVPLYYGNGLLYGAHADIKPSQYPAGWYSADQILVSDGHPGLTLFLPWHEYMSMSFVRNQNSVVASPAPTFFSTPVLVSADPEVPGIVPLNDPDQVAVTILVRAGDRGPWAQALAEHGVKYILLAREVDWQSYRYLDKQPWLVKLADFGSIILYRNTLVN